MPGLRLAVLAILFALTAMPVMAADPAPVPPPAAAAAKPAMPPFVPPSTDASKAPAGLYVVDKSHAGLMFRISHLGFSLYHGRFNDFDAKINLDPTAPEKSSIEVTVQVASVDTHNAKLEEELRSDQWFKTAQFPVAIFKSTKLTKTGPNTGEVDGDFTMMGVTRPVRMAVTFHGYGPHPMNKKPTLGFSAAGTIKRSQWGFTQGAPFVGDDVLLQFDGEFNKADAAPAVTPPPAPPAPPATPAKP